MEGIDSPLASEGQSESSESPAFSSSAGLEGQHGHEAEECRVCRGGAEIGSLFKPCKCSGSIRYVHQECLEMWLRHKNSNSEKCELCGCIYYFSPRFADDAPSSLGGLSLTVALIKRVFSYGMPTFFRLLCIFSSWVIFVPLCTHWMYRIVVHTPFVSKLSEVSSEWSISSFKEWLSSELVSGIVVTLLILSSTVILMSFVDFLRFQQVAGADGQEFVVVLPPPPPEHEHAIHHPRNPTQTGLAALYDRPDRQWRVVKENELHEQDMGDLGTGTSSSPPSHVPTRPTKNMKR